MDDLFSSIILLGIIVIIGFFGFYVAKTYLSPKKLDELADMIKQGQFNQAIKRLQTMIQENDRDPYLHFLLGEAYRLQGNDAQALASYKNILRVSRFNSKVTEESVRSKLAPLYLRMGLIDEAKKEFLILTKLEPSNANNFYQVGLLFEKAGMFDKAINYFRQAIKVNPASPDALLHDGIITYQLGNYMDAKNSLAQAVKLDPSLSEGHYYLGLCLKSQKDYEWSIKEFDMACNDAKLKGKASLGKGLIYLEKNQPERAVEEFESGLTSTQKGSSIELNLRYYIGVAAENMRDLHTAISNWEIINDIDPQYKDVAEKLSFYEDFRTEDAIKDFMIAPPTEFEKICKSLISNIQLSVIEFSVESDTEVRALATESESKWGSSKLSNRLVYILRTTDPIPEKLLREMNETMRKKNATKGVCMATSAFTSQAEKFCQSRPIELIDKTKIISHLRSIVNV